MLLGLISSTFSTLVSQLMAARIGRDAVIEWMVVASIPLRSQVFAMDPSWGTIAAGILFHQWADFSWALVFFGLLGRWTGSLKPLTILLVALPWAVFTSATEWFFLVPLVPFWQPVFTLEQPYWIGLLVHMTSASMYPLFPWLRDRLGGRLPSLHRRFALAWSAFALIGLLCLGAAAFLGWHDRELPWMGRDAAYDQGYMRRMAAHHAQGIELARIAVEKAQEPYLRDLARLMAANQKGEITIFAQWWRSWFPGPLQPPTEDYATMPGMLSSGQIESLRRAEGSDFDPLFISLMTMHHKGAILMADEALRQAGDIRLRLMAHATRHSQRGEIEMMHGTEGLAAVKAATLSMIVPVGEASADRRGSPLPAHPMAH
ncbi:DUF305 domain-containing protein [Microvirga sp. TS319]|uniref:DUF305 domain-containing protein n=1 Tax=Microvirga sp. TS319 TaxID=3241165 RepID=UPI00351A2EDF